MMIRTAVLGVMALFALTVSSPGARAAVVEIGVPAPEFTGTDTNGQTHSLSDYKGKIVVLEWTNHECPYVKKQYDSGNMQALQKEMTGDGVIWLSIVSSAPGKQGHVSAAEANEIIAQQGAHATARILDESGEIGHLYGAQTTPHMFVIGPDGVLAYQGAIDSDDSFRPEAIEGATNYVRTAVAALKEGKPVDPAQTKSYGCGVKY